MTLKLYIGGKLILEKEQKPQSEWKIDPVFLEGVGDDSKLVQVIKQYFESGVNSNAKERERTTSPTLNNS